jgi:hypothetical protein
MRRVTFLAGVFLVAAAPASPGQVIVYDNTTTPLVSAFQNGGAANQGGNTITRYVADDVTPLAGFAGRSVTQFTLSVANLNSTPVMARPRVRFFLPDGPGQAPGTGLASLAFPATTFAATSISLITSSILAPGQFVIPTGFTFFWAGVVFDDNNGATGATLAQLNMFGQGAFNPPSAGSSVDIFFLSSAAGVPGDNPAGNLQNFGGSPPANFGWRFEVAAVPEPGPLVLLLPAAMGLLARAGRARTWVRGRLASLPAARTDERDQAVRE